MRQVVEEYFVFFGQILFLVSMGLLLLLGWFELHLVVLFLLLELLLLLLHLLLLGHLLGLSRLLLHWGDASEELLAEFRIHLFVLNIESKRRHSFTSDYLHFMVICDEFCTFTRMGVLWK